MVHGMKPPQEWHFMQSQMNEVFGDIRHHDSQKKLQKPRHSSDRVLQNRNA